MYYTRCLSCKVALLRDRPFTLLDRICKTCLDILRMQAEDEQYSMEDLKTAEPGNVELAG